MLMSWWRSWRRWRVGRGDPSPGLRPGVASHPGRTSPLLQTDPRADPGAEKLLRRPSCYCTIGLRVERIEASFVTTTTYGSWLPGDVRGYVEDGVPLPASPPLAAYATTRMKGDAVRFSDREGDELHLSIVAAANEFGYRLSDLVIEATHAHWIIAHDDEMEAMVGRLKNRMRQRLSRGRIWTTGYCGVEIRDLKGLHDARNYLAQHRGLRILAGEVVKRP
jgi:hypothetical protein